MWVPGSIAFLLPLFWIGVELLFGSQRGSERPKVEHRRGRCRCRSSLLPVIDARGRPRPSRRRSICCDVPLVGRFLRWRRARPADASRSCCCSPRWSSSTASAARSVSPMNLAGVLPWIHWRGLVDSGTAGGRQRLLHGLPVHAAAHARPPLAARRPARGRAGCAANGWPSALVALFLWSYEAFALWDSPWLTAWIAIGYFVGRVRRRRLLSRRGVLQVRLPDRPVQLRAVARLAAGSDGPRAGRLRDVPDARTAFAAAARSPGCEHAPVPAAQARQSGLHVLPRLRPRLPARQRRHPRRPVRANRCGATAFRSGIGRFSRRARPGGTGAGARVRRIRQRGGHGRAGRRVARRVASALGRSAADRRGSACSTLLALVAAPVVLVGTAAASAATWRKRSRARHWRVATRYAYALVPLGFAHVAGASRLSLVHQLPNHRAGGAADVARFRTGACSARPSGSAPAVRPSLRGSCSSRLLALDFGLLGRCTRPTASPLPTLESPARTVKAFVPWGLLIVLLFAVGVWIVTEPMQMRGTLPPVG